jgi:hypothetical protein
MFQEYSCPTASAAPTWIPLIIRAQYWEILDDRERVEAQRIAVRTNV